VRLCTHMEFHTFLECVLGQVIEGGSRFRSGIEAYCALMALE